MSAEEVLMGPSGSGKSTSRASQSATATTHPTIGEGAAAAVRNTTTTRKKVAR